MKRARYLLSLFLLVPEVDAPLAEEARPKVNQEMSMPVASTQSEVPPDLSKVHTPRLTQALASPEALWEFITASETDYTERRAAAVQGAGIFPLRWLPRLLAVQAELEKEEGLHGWGLKRHPGDARPPSELPLDRFLATGLPRERQVLSHHWVVPEKAVAFPLSWKEEAVAPWPWQVQQALRHLSVMLCPDYYGRPRAPAWLEETLQLPWGTDGEARTFVGLSNCSSHFKTMAVMARWQKISLDPSKPNAARDVAINLCSAVGSWDDPVSQTVGQVLLVDIVRSSPHEFARQQVAYWLGNQRNSWRDGKNLRMPLPVTSVLAVSEAALNPARGDSSTRLFYYVSGVCDVLDSRHRDPNSGLLEGKFFTGDDWNQPPLDPTPLRNNVESRIDPQSSKVEGLLRRFEQWFQRNEKKLRAEAEKESSEIDRVRRELLVLEP